MSLGKVFGCIGLIFAGILLFCLAVLWLQKRFPSKEFDERQQVSRGKAGELGLLVGVVYFLAIMPVMIGQVDGKKTIEPYLLVFFGVMVTHDYTLGKNFITILGTILMVCVIMFVAILFFALLGKIYAFGYNIFFEISTRL